MPTATAQAVFPITSTTKRLLDNLSKIAPQVTLASGAVQRVTGPGKAYAVMATATLSESWPAETAIYNFDKFLGVLSMYEKPTIRFTPDTLVVENDGRGSATKFKLSDPSTIDKVPTKTLPTDHPLAEILLPKATIDQIKKSAALLNLTHFTTSVTENAVAITVFNAQTPNSHAFDVDVQDATIRRSVPAFKITVQVDHMSLLLDGDYMMTVHENWPYLFLTHKNYPVTYYIAKDVAVK
jgi:hypothetical protein